MLQFEKPFYYMSRVVKVQEIFNEFLKKNGATAITYASVLSILLACVSRISIIDWYGGALSCVLQVCSTLKGMCFWPLLEIVCNAYETFHNNDPPIPTHYLREMLGVILTENSFEFNEKNYLQTHGVAMGTKTAVSFANIFMAEIETNLMQQNNTKPREWKRYIDDVFSLWDCNRNEVERFIEQTNTFHPTIKFTAEISENEIIFLDTVVFKGERFIKESIPDIKTHYKPTETFQYTHFTSCHPPGVKRGFIKGEAIRLLRTNSSKTTFEKCLTNFKRRLEARGYPKNYIESSLSEVTFDSRQSALNQQKHKTAERILPFVTTYHPAVKKLKQIVMENRSFIENQPLLKKFFTNPPIISYKRGKSLKDMLVRAKL